MISAAKRTARARHAGELPAFYVPQARCRGLFAGPYWRETNLSEKDQDYLYRREVCRNYVKREVYYRNTRRVRTLLKSIEGE